MIIKQCSQFLYPPIIFRKPNLMSFHISIIIFLLERTYLTQRSVHKYLIRFLWISFDFYDELLL